MVIIRINWVLLLKQQTASPLILRNKLEESPGNTERPAS